MPHPEPRWLDEAARVYRPGWRHSGCLAAPGTRATAGKTADHRVSGCGHGCRARPTATAAFLQRLRELGWIEGRTVTIEYRWAEGRSERYRRDRGRVRPAQGRRHRHGRRRGLRSKAGDIGHPDRLRHRGGPARQRPRGEPRATGRQRHRTVDPVGGAAGKRLELLREVVPGLRRLAIMANGDNPRRVLEIGEVQAAARTLGLEVVTLEIRRAEEIAPAFDALKTSCGCTLCRADPLVSRQPGRINTLALSARLPTITFSARTSKPGA